METKSRLVLEKVMSNGGTTRYSIRSSAFDVYQSVFVRSERRENTLSINPLIHCAKFQWKPHSRSQQTRDFSCGANCGLVLRTETSETRAARGGMEGWRDERRDLRKRKQMADTHLHSRGPVGFIGTT